MKIFNSTFLRLLFASTLLFNTPVSYSKESSADPSHQNASISRDFAPLSIPEYSIPEYLSLNRLLKDSLSAQLALNQSHFEQAVENFEFEFSESAVSELSNRLVAINHKILSQAHKSSQEREKQRRRRQIHQQIHSAEEILHALKLRENDLRRSEGELLNPIWMDEKAEKELESWDRYFKEGIQRETWLGDRDKPALLVLFKKWFRQRYQDLALLSMEMEKGYENFFRDRELSMENMEELFTQSVDRLIAQGNFIWLDFSYPGRVWTPPSSINFFLLSIFPQLTESKPKKFSPTINPEGWEEYRHNLFQNIYDPQPPRTLSEYIEEYKRHLLNQYHSLIDESRRGYSSPQFTGFIRDEIGANVYQNIEKADSKYFSTIRIIREAEDITKNISPGPVSSDNSTHPALDFLDTWNSRDRSRTEYKQWRNVMLDCDWSLSYPDAYNLSIDNYSINYEKFFETPPNFYDDPFPACPVIRQFLKQAALRYVATVLQTSLPIVDSFDSPDETSLPHIFWPEGKEYEDHPLREMYFYAVLVEELSSIIDRLWEISQMESLTDKYRSFGYESATQMETSLNSEQVSLLSQKESLTDRMKRTYEKSYSRYRLTDKDVSSQWDKISLISKLYCSGLNEDCGLIGDEERAYNFLIAYRLARRPYLLSKLERRKKWPILPETTTLITSSVTEIEEELAKIDSPQQMAEKMRNTVHSLHRLIDQKEAEYREAKRAVYTFPFAEAEEQVEAERTQAIFDLFRHFSRYSSNYETREDLMVRLSDQTLETERQISELKNQWRNLVDSKDLTEEEIRAIERDFTAANQTRNQTGNQTAAELVDDFQLDTYYDEVPFLEKGLLELKLKIIDQLKSGSAPRIEDLLNGILLEHYYKSPQKPCTSCNWLPEVFQNLLSVTGKGGMEGFKHFRKMLAEIVPSSEEASELSKLKPLYEEMISSKLFNGEALTYNREAVGLTYPLLANRLQCYSGSLLFFVMSELTGFSLSPRFALFTEGHVLPGFLSEKDPLYLRGGGNGGSKRTHLKGVESTAAWAGLVDFGPVSDLKGDIRVVEMYAFLLIEFLKSEVSNFKSLYSSTQKALEPLGFETQNLLPMEESPLPPIAEELREKAPRQAGEVSDSVVGAASSEEDLAIGQLAQATDPLLNESPFAFGAPNTPAGDQVRGEISDDKDLSFYLSSSQKDRAETTSFFFPPSPQSPLRLSALSQAETTSFFFPPSPPPEKDFFFSTIPHPEHSSITFSLTPGAAPHTKLTMAASPKEYPLYLKSAQNGIVFSMINIRKDKQMINIYFPVSRKALYLELKISATEFLVSTGEELTPGTLIAKTKDAFVFYIKEDKNQNFEILCIKPSDYTRRLTIHQSYTPHPKCSSS